MYTLMWECMCGCMDAVFKEKVALKNLGGNNENKGWKEIKKIN